VGGMMTARFLQPEILNVLRSQGQKFREIYGHVECEDFLDFRTKIQTVSFFFFANAQSSQHIH